MSTLSGHDMAVIGPTFTSFKLPFGIVHPANLTPDRDTGLGGWTEAMFLRAVRTGRHMGGNGRPILPPMPWMNLAQQSDDDLRAVFAYLRSIPAIRNDVPAPQVPDQVDERHRGHVREDPLPHEGAGAGRDAGGRAAASSRSPVRSARDRSRSRRRSGRARARGAGRRGTSAPAAGAAG